ncbi:MAG: MBL fold metallo-hydrolase, partial [Candidatus Diapherotrites archaeon]|nr:MBL fold metallo-hydrolase [Candidatus Diapherotrites archaeon]
LSNSIDEQSLAVKTKKGLVVLVGCSHPGVTQILRKASEFGKVHAIIGGFHGFSDFDALHGIDLVAATHCTQHKQQIKKMFPSQFRECGAGVEFSF